MTLRDFMPAILDLAATAGKEAIIGGIRAHYAERAAGNLPTPVSTGDSPPVHEGCPYCAASKQLAIAHRYLMRATRKPNYGPIYVELSRAATGEAILAIDHIPGQTTPDIPTLRLSEQLIRLEVALSKPVHAPNYRALADMAWDIGDLALELAERLNASKNAGDALAAEMDRRIAALEKDATVIDGEAVVL